MSFGKRTYSFAGTGGAWRIPPQPTIGGAAYTYEGGRGTVRLSYENHTQSFTGAAVTVDASKDRKLREWIGSDRATGAAMVAAGDWTGTARLEE